MTIRLELGGGSRPRGEGGFLNVDRVACPRVDVVCDLDRERLPFADESVAEVYSSHCLEHLEYPLTILREVCRVCHAGARVELRVPHPYGEMALCPGHVYTISEAQLRHWTSDFVAESFPPGLCPRRLRLLRTERIPSEHFARLRRLYPAPPWTDEDVLRFAPGACHELRFILEVVRNEP